MKIRTLALAVLLLSAAACLASCVRRSEELSLETESLYDSMEASPMERAAAPQRLSLPSLHFSSTAGNSADIKAESLPEEFETTYENLAADQPGQDEGRPGSDENAETDLVIRPAADTQGRKLIHMVDMDLETTAFDDLHDQIMDRIDSLGGYVESSETAGGGMASSSQRRLKSARIVARVPDAQLDTFLAGVDETGAVVRKSASTTDVSLQYSDIESRKKTLAIEQDRIWALLEKADSMDAVVTLEARLSEIRYELETYESQLRLYDDQVSYSTVTLLISEVITEPPREQESLLARIRREFLANLNKVADGVANLFIWFLVTSPILVPIAAIIFVLYLVRRKVFRGKVRKSLEKKIPPSDVKP